MSIPQLLPRCRYHYNTISGVLTVTAPLVPPTASAYQRRTSLLPRVELTDFTPRSLIPVLRGLHALHPQGQLPHALMAAAAQHLAASLAVATPAAGGDAATRALAAATNVPLARPRLPPKMLVVGPEGLILRGSGRDAEVVLPGEVCVVMRHDLVWFGLITLRECVVWGRCMNVIEGLFPTARSQASSIVCVCVECVAGRMRASISPFESVADVIAVRPEHNNAGSCDSVLPPTRARRTQHTPRRWCRLAPLRSLQSGRTPIVRLPPTVL